ncbi:MAG: TIGR03960 family B12-binding radical SAM protein [Candidatus Eisenbacteria bacterium]
MSELLERLEREVLPLVARPSRYTGGERNVPRKDPADVDLSFLLAFPDVYEIGMSHLGIRMLYDILNRRPDVVAERTFAPWIDMEALMREKNVPLFSIEGHRAARDFDVIGFTLQYELHYTNLLMMLDLASVPLHAANRGEDDPLIIGGGPSALNPEPVAAFFDLLVVGDGESAVLDIADLVIGAKRERLNRAELLRRAAALPGVYVPLLYEERYESGRYAGTFPADETPTPGDGGAVPARIQRRAEHSIDYAGHPAAPIVPVTETTHDRLAVEIMRGCTRGCRFCQPGMITRPVRPRPTEDVVRLVDEGLAASGYDEVSLVSLSTSDYDELPELISCLNERLFDRKVSIALPSLRVDRFGLELADAIGKVRRSGLTFAPEAGTQRLRDVVNKNETEESILETVDVAFASGWNRIKLYFMIGLPTETEDDLEGIVRLVSKVRAAAKKRRKGARINVSVSPFVPRAHTPFQWERQDSAEETRSKERFLRDRFRQERGVKLATRDPEVSFLEGVMSRGDRSLSRVIEVAFRAGARFDGWTETFDFGVWRAAFEEAGVQAAGFLRARDPDAPLPWDHIDGGPSREFLLAEREKARLGELTPDCREAGCFDCGACAAGGVARGAAGRGMPERQAASTPAQGPARTHGRRGRKVRPGDANGTRWRVRYAKGDAVRFVSHLDVVRAVLRSLALSGLPVVFTQGFSPHPKLSFGPPLPVGSTGEAEFFDLEFTRALAVEEIEPGLSEGLPEGLGIISVTPLTSKRSPSAVAEGAEYLVSNVPGLDGLSAEGIGSRIDALRRMREAEVPKGGGVKTVRPSEQILELAVVEEGIAPELRPPVLRMVLALGKEGAIRPVDVVRLLSPEGAAPPVLARIHRTALLRRTTNGGPGLEPVR